MGGRGFVSDEWGTSSPSLCVDVFLVPKKITEEQENKKPPRSITVCEGSRARKRGEEDLAQEGEALWLPRVAFQTCLCRGEAERTHEAGVPPRGGLRVQGGVEGGVGGGSGVAVSLMSGWDSALGRGVVRRQYRRLRGG